MPRLAAAHAGMHQLDAAAAAYTACLKLAPGKQGVHNSPKRCCGEECAFHITAVGSFHGADLLSCDDEPLDERKWQRVPMSAKSRSEESLHYGPKQTSAETRRAVQSARPKAAFREKEQGEARANGHTPLAAANAASGAKPPAAGAQPSPRMKATPASQHGSRAAAPAGSSMHHSAAAQGRDVGAETRDAWVEPASQRMRAAATATRSAHHAGQPAPRAAPPASPVKQPDSASRTDKRPDYAAKKGPAGSMPLEDSSPDYSAAPKAKAAEAVPSAPRAHLPGGVPSGDGMPDYSARTGKGAAEPHPYPAQGMGARPGSAAAAACKSCVGTATAMAALAQDMQSLQAFSRQMLQEVMGEMRGLRDRSASLDGHVRRLGAEVARLAELLQSGDCSNGERSPASDFIFLLLLAHPACLWTWHNCLNGSSSQDQRFAVTLKCWTDLLRAKDNAVLCSCSCSMSGTFIREPPPA